MRRLREIHSTAVTHGERVERTVNFEARPLGDRRSCIEPGYGTRIHAEQEGITTLFASAQASSSESNFKFLDSVAQKTARSRREKRPDQEHCGQHAPE